MDGLPEEIVLDILARLPIRSLVLSKSVCRAWHRIIQDPAFVNKHHSRMVDDQSEYPSFILQCDHPIPNQLYYGDFSGDHHQNNQVFITKKLPMPPLHNFQLLSSCNGLLCLRAAHPSYALSIYNPFTVDHAELPKLTKYPPCSEVLGFGFVPTTKEYKVLDVLDQKTVRVRSDHVTGFTGIDVGGDQVAPSFIYETNVHILTLGSSSTWRNIGTLPYLFMKQQSQVLVNGKLHWVLYPKEDCRVTSFDLATEQFQDVPLPDGIRLGQYLDHLVVLKGCLSATTYHDEELEIWVMKEYDVEESWVKEFSIRTYVPNVRIRFPQSNGHTSFDHLSFCWPRKYMRILCQLRSGDLLLEYYCNQALVLYDPHCGTLKNLQLTFEGIRKSFRVYDHVASFNWSNNFANTNVTKIEPEVKLMNNPVSDNFSIFSVFGWLNWFNYFFNRIE